MYNLYMPEGKIGSEHWLLTLLEDRLHPVEIFWGHTKESKIDNEYPFVVIDDAIYSGCNMAGIVDNFRYDTHIKNHFYCLVAITSAKTPQVCDFGATVIADKILTDLTLANMFPENNDEMYELYGCETGCVLPLFFDHKIANEFGSYQFYHKIISPPVSRAPVDTVTRETVMELV